MPLVIGPDAAHCCDYLGNFTAAAASAAWEPDARAVPSTVWSSVYQVIRCLWLWTWVDQFLKIAPDLLRGASSKRGVSQDFQEHSRMFSLGTTTTSTTNLLSRSSSTRERWIPSSHMPTGLLATKDFEKSVFSACQSYELIWGPKE